ncbi:hypothetical protein BCR35DRAFT_298838 [Leucosporidium creatinivorum]|uniref:Atos-like conserved domain-containing protein n=1 Tax=Leucosporidium creatinivorum TaxID=106004 RepID=A0A1Y2G2K5_9BASI|nr:hypothetical protein BCR35DRAFT_298838 [Leucosporidium creatinivorum]
MSWGRFQDHRPTRPSSMSVSTTRSETESSTATLSPSSEPIAIPSSPSPYSPSPSSYQQLHTSFDSSASFISQAVDGPLQDLLPAFSHTAVSSGSSEGEGAFVGSPSPRLGFGRPGDGQTAFSKRVVSAPIPYSTSPRSPLAGSSSPDPSSSSPRRRSAQFPLPGSPTPSPHAPSPSSNTLHPSPTPTRRRRSSVSLSSSTGSAPPFGSLVGSFEQSLLSGRLSALPSLPLPFVASIGVLGGKDAPTRLRCPPHLTIPFGAFYYTNGEGTKSSAPYVGTVELDSHYISLLHPPSPTAADSPSPLPTPSPNPPPPPPRFPGYRVPRVGQIQLVIKNPHATAIKLFLIPYDLTGLERGGKGGKTFLRQKSYTVEASAGEDSKGRLRYAVHLQFCCPPTGSGKGAGGGAAAGARATAGGGAKTKPPAEPKYYLHGNLRIVFASRGLDSTEKLRVVAEGPEGVHSAGAAGEVGAPSKEEDRFAPYGGPGLEWEIAKRKSKERERMRELTAAAEGRSRGAAEGESEGRVEEHQVPQDGDLSSPPLRPPPHVHDPNGTTYDLSRSSSPLSPSTTALAFSLATFSSALPTASPLPYPRTTLPRSSLSESLSFASRPASPIPPLLSNSKHRSASLSGLSNSRPPSRTGSDGSGSGSGKSSAGDCGR